MHANTPTILLSSRPRIISSSKTKGIFEIDGLYPGYGITVGNVLRRILLSSLPGAAVTQVKIDGIQHEFSTIPHVREDVITILLNIKKLRFHMHTDEPQHIEIAAQGTKNITGKDLKVPSMLEVVNPDLHIVSLTDKQAKFNAELIVESGLGYVSREVAHHEKVEVGMMTIDALFSPMRRAHYEVENMRVGDRTDYNRLRLTIETDGTLSPEDAFQKAAEIAVQQFSALVGNFSASSDEATSPRSVEMHANEDESSVESEQQSALESENDEMDYSKVKIEDLRLPSRTIHALHEHGIKTVGGLMRRDAEALSKIPGIGDKAILEVKRALGSMGLTLK
ncbi:MAG: DNA-directed RNA polymerase subunit alpha [Parcubacteria group bacterium Gr01-1014_29]|nr:MAG: DNA-directed RNA polymerase subunit alpha [Parcubacteria group bacterium Gr01-1014_29]